MDERQLEVIEVERRWARAHQELDLKTIDSVLAEDYVQIKADGSRVDKGAALASYRSGDRRWEIAESDELEVRIYGEAALVIGRWRGKGVNHGEPFDYDARFISLYIYHDDGWKLTAEMSAPLPGATAEPPA